MPLDRTRTPVPRTDSGGAQDTGAPGKQTLTQRLQRSPSPDAIAASMIQQLGLGGVQRKEDVAAALDGERALAVAASGFGGAGSAPPQLEAIQRSFGHHDVSGVQAHIGGAAADASRALGARAYASGDQVAFAEQPDTFLIAHELAHVVQQRGGVQLSGSVGAAGDEHERHADEVAERVVRGESAEALLDRYAGGGTAVQRAVQRYETGATDLESVAERTETAAREEVEADTSNPVAAMSNVGDVGAAQAEVRRIQAARPNLMTAIEERLSGFDNDLLAQNEGAIDALQDYVHQGQGQGDSIATFQAQYRQLRVDFARLEAQMRHFQGSEQGGATREQSGGAALGRAAVEAVGATPGATPSRGDADQNQLRNDANASQQRMMGLSRQLPGAWSGVIQARQRVHAGVQWLASGLPVRQETEAQQAHQRVRGRVDRIAGHVSSVVSIAQQIASAYTGGAAGTAINQGVQGAVGGSEEAAGSAVDAVSGGISNLVGDWEARIVEFIYLPELDRAQAEAIASVEAEQHAEIQRRHTEIVQADTQMKEQIRTYLTLVVDFDHAKRAYRDAVRNSAGPQDQTGGRREGILGEFTAESGAFLAQARATQQLGEQLASQGAQVSATRRALHHGDDGPVQWNEAVRVPYVSRGGASWQRRQNTVNIANMGTDSAEGDSRARDPQRRGANAAVTEAVAEIARMRASVEGFHGQVATPLGLASRSRE